MDISDTGVTDLFASYSTPSRNYQRDKTLILSGSLRSCSIGINRFRLDGLSCFVFYWLKTVFGCFGCSAFSIRIKLGWNGWKSIGSDRCCFHLLFATCVISCAICTTRVTLLVKKKDGVRVVHPLINFLRHLLLKLPREQKRQQHERGEHTPCLPRGYADRRVTR